MSSHRGIDWQAHGDAVESLVLAGGGILAYALLVIALAPAMSRRDLLGWGHKRESTLVRTLYAYLFPLVTFAFFVVLGSALIILGGPEQSPRVTLSLVVAVVLAVRLAAYLDARTSEALARILPLAMLGATLMAAELPTFSDAWQNMRTIGQHGALIVLYLAIVALVEYILLGIGIMVQSVRARRPPRRPSRPPRPSGAHGAEPRGPRPPT